MSPTDRAPAQVATGKPELDEVEKADKFYDDEDLIAPTAEEKAAYVRKLDFHIMPVIFLIYMLSVLVCSSAQSLIPHPKEKKITSNSLLTHAVIHTGPVEFRQCTPSRTR